MHRIYAAKMGPFVASSLIGTALVLGGGGFRSPFLALSGGLLLCLTVIALLATALGRLSAALGAIAAVQKQVLELREWGGASEKNVSARIERTRKEVKQRLVVIRKELDGVSEKLDAVQTVTERNLGLLEDGGVALRKDDARRFDAMAGNVTKLSRQVSKAEYQIVQHVEALLELRRIFPLPTTPPLLGGWAMDPMAMLRLVNHVLDAKPVLIVECGSGTSTIWLGHALKKNGKGRIISIEHDESFASKTSDAVKRQGLDDIVELRMAPLEEMVLAGATRSWYAPGALSGLSGIDMLLVDGPPASTGELARYPALPLFADSLSPGCFVVLDDVSRSEEKMISKRWKEEFPQLQDEMVLAPRTRGFIWRQDGAGSGK